jgi:hypothetical protein
MGDIMTASHSASSSLGGFVRRNSRIIIGLLAATAIQLALVSAWAGAMGSPTLHQQPVGLVVARGASLTAANVTGVQPDAIAWRPLADSQLAARRVRNGDLAGAVIVGRSSEQLLTASASGPLTTQSLTKAISGQAAAAGLSLRVQDVRPLQSGDPRGLGIFVLVLGWVIGGYVGTTLLLRGLGRRAKTLRGTAVVLGWQAAYAAGAAALGVLLIDPLLGMVTGHPAALFGVGALLIFAVGLFATALMSLLGPAGLILAVGTLVIVGNPASGGTVPTQMLPAGWRFLAEIVPNAAGVRLVRSVTYFGNHGIADPLVVLASYAGLSILVLAATAWRRRPAVPTTGRPGTRKGTGSHSSGAVSPAGVADRALVTTIAGS